jgi:hypothetical protein
MVLFVCDKDPIIFLSDLVVCPFLAEQRRQKTVLPSVAGEFHQHNGSTFTLTILYVFIQCAVLVGLSIKKTVAQRAAVDRVCLETANSSSRKMKRGSCN